MYVVTVSMPGYMSEGDPIECETIEDAREAARGEIEHLLDFHAMGEEGEEVTVSELAEGFVWHVGTDRPHDLGMVIEIHTAEE